jgi:hypothetical protein
MVEPSNFDYKANKTIGLPKTVDNKESINPDPVLEAALKYLPEEKTAPSQHEDHTLKKIHKESSHEQNLTEKAVEDTSIITKSFGPKDAHPVEANIKVKVDSLRKEWNEPHVFIYSKETAEQFTKLNDNFNEAKGGSYTLSVDPKNPNLLQITFYSKPDLKTEGYVTLSVPIHGNKLIWENTTYSNPHELVTAISKKLSQPMLSVGALPCKRIAEILNNPAGVKLVERDSRSLTYALHFLILNDQLKSAEQLLTKVWSEIPKSLTTDLITYGTSLQNSERLISFIVEKSTLEDLTAGVNEFSNNLYLSKYLNKLQPSTLIILLKGFIAKEGNAYATIDPYNILMKLGPIKEVRDIVFENPNILSSIPEHKKTLIGFLLLDQGSLEEFKTIIATLKITNYKWQPIEESLDDFLREVVNTYTTNFPALYKLIKENRPNLLTPSMKEKFIMRTLYEPAMFEKLKNDFPELFPLTAEQVTKVLAEKPLVSIASIVGENPPVVDIFKKSNQVWVLEPLVEFIKDEATAEKVVLLAMDSSDVTRKLFDKFPNILNNKSLIKEILRYSHSEAIKYEIIQKLPPDVLNELNKDGRISTALMKYLYVPTGDVDKLAEVIKSDPFINTAIFYALAQANYLDFSDPKWNDFFKNNIKYVSSDHVESAVVANNMSFIKLVLNNNVAVSALNLISTAANLKINDFVTFTPKLKFEPNQVVQALIMSNNIPFAEEFKRLNSIDVSDDANLLKIAIERGTLSMEILFLGGDLDKIASRYTQFDPEKLRFTLIRNFLNSKIQDVDLLISALKKQDLTPEQRAAVDEAEKYIHTGGKHIARFASKDYQVSMMDLYGKGKQYKSYVDQQYTYGNNRAQLSQRVLEGIRKENWDIMRVISELTGFSETQPNPEISKWRNYNLKSDQVSTPVVERYGYFRNVINSMDIELKKGKVNTFHGPDYTITHTLPNGKNVALTQSQSRVEAGVQNYYWVHTKDIMPGLQEMERLLTILKNYKSDSVSESMPEDLRDTIIQFYWLGVQIMPTTRNFSQTMLDLHAIVHTLTGYDSAPPSIEYGLADCVALSTTYEKFKALYNRVFEGQPKRLVK